MDIPSPHNHLLYCSSSLVDTTYLLTSTLQKSTPNVTSVVVIIYDALNLCFKFWPDSILHEYLLLELYFEKERFVFVSVEPIIENNLSVSQKFHIG